MKITQKCRIFRWMLMIVVQTMKIPIKATAGVSARIPHTTDFAIFLDYDNATDERLVDELLYLQELFRLGDFIVVATNEFARHAICIDRLTLKEALEVVYVSTCDAIFKKGIRINEYRTWILRGIGKGNRSKPKFLYTVESPYNGQRLQSQAHGQYLQRNFGANVRLVNPDENTELEIQGYKTDSKVSENDIKK
jgi:hypothetical protein